MKHNYLSELKFKAIRSSGAGGQHVNKVSSKIELTFHLEILVVLNNEQKDCLLRKFKNKTYKRWIVNITMW